MDVNKLQRKIQMEIPNKEEAKDLANVLCDSPKDFQEIVSNWIAGKTDNYIFGDISLDMIQQKEQCSYLQALLRMQLLISNPTLAAGYKHWTPVNKDWKR